MSYSIPPAYNNYPSQPQLQQESQPPSNNGISTSSTYNSSGNNHGNRNTNILPDIPLGPLDDTHKFFLANMSYSLTAQQVKQWFSQFGVVNHVKIIYDKSGNSKGYGFLYMNSYEDAHAVEQFAASQNNMISMLGRSNVHCARHDKARIKEQRNNNNSNNQSSHGHSHSHSGLSKEGAGAGVSGGGNSRDGRYPSQGQGRQQQQQSQLQNYNYNTSESNLYLLTSNQTSMYNHGDSIHNNDNHYNGQSQINAYSQYNPTATTMSSSTTADTNIIPEGSQQQRSLQANHTLIPSQQHYPQINSANIQTNYTTNNLPSDVNVNVNMNVPTQTTSYNNISYNTSSTQQMHMTGGNYNFNNHNLPPQHFTNNNNNNNNNNNSNIESYPPPQIFVSSSYNQGGGTSQQTISIPPPPPPPPPSTLPLMPSNNYSYSQPLQLQPPSMIMPLQGQGNTAMGVASLIENNNHSSNTAPSHHLPLQQSQLPISLPHQNQTTTTATATATATSKLLFLENIPTNTQIPQLIDFFSMTHNISIYNASMEYDPDPQHHDWCYAHIECHSLHDASVILQKAKSDQLIFKGRHLMASIDISPPPGSGGMGGTIGKGGGGGRGGFVSSSSSPNPRHTAPYQKNGYSPGGRGYGGSGSSSSGIAGGGGGRSGGGRSGGYRGGRGRGGRNNGGRGNFSGRMRDNRRDRPY